MPTITEATYYEVSWGIEENERQAWVNPGDGSGAGDHAQALAYRTLVELHRSGRKAGLFVNGVHEDGADFAEEWAEVEAADATALIHKTTTFLYDFGTHLNWRKVQIIGDQFAWATCTCGWKVLRDNRALARQDAKRHRTAEETK